MLIFQWSARPRDDCWIPARRLIHRFADFTAASLQWPKGDVLVSHRRCTRPTLTLEVRFEDASEFEAAWQRLLCHTETVKLWGQLAVVLDEDSIQRAVFEVQYARAGTAER